MVSEEFNNIFVLDLGGDVRVDPRLSGTKHNVFGIQTGVAISFMVKRANTKERKIQYSRRPQFEIAEDKLAYLGTTKITSVQFDVIKPDKKNNWINIADNDFDSLIPSASRETKLAKSASQERAIFRSYTLGVVTARDDWVYDFDRKNLIPKIRYLIKTYNADLERIGGKGSKKDVSSELNSSIKWTRGVKRNLGKGVSYKFSEKKIIRASYRPFVSEWLYRDNYLNEMPNQTPLIFGDGSIQNSAITVMGDSTGKPYFCLAINTIPDYNFVSPASGGTQTLALHRLDSSGNRIENITDWAIERFRANYRNGKASKQAITKNAIFHYVYGVLHDPIYREKYALNLKRDFPRIPFYADFWKWAGMGREADGAAHRLRDGRAVAARAHRHARRKIAQGRA